MGEKTEKTFEDTITEGLDTIETQQQTLIKNYDQLDKDTKKAMEELTLVKNAMNSQKEQLTAIQKLNLQLQREQRMAYGNPIERILANEEYRNLLNACARYYCKVPLSEKHQKAFGENTSPGSTLIDDKLAKEIYDTLQQFGKWNTLGVRRLTTKQTKFAVKTARPVAQFVLTEANTIADDTSKAGTSVTCQVELIAVLLNVSRQLLDDAESDVAADVLNDFIEALNFRLDVASFTADGTGDGNNGGMTGLFNFGTVATAAAGNTVAERLDLDDFIRCLTTVDSAVISRPSKWWVHPQILVRFLSVKDSNGRPIFLTAIEAPSRGGIGSILGYPTELVEAAPSTNTAGKKLAAFGDPNSMVVGVRTDFALESSDDFRWNTFERSFRGVGRAGTKGRRALGSAILTTAAV